MKGKNFSFIYRAEINECGKSKSLVVFPITKSADFRGERRSALFMWKGNK